MHLLILDFMARRWWLFLGIFAFAVLGASLGALFVFTPFVMVGMTIDQQQGWLRAVCGLPVSRRAQATAWWSVGVLMPVLVSTLGLLVGALIFQLTSGPQLTPLPDAPTYTLVLNPKYFAPLFSVAVGVSFGLGYAAHCFLIFFVFPTRVRGKFGLACLAMFSPLAQFGPMFIGFILPKNPGMMVTWHWVIFALVPVLVFVSWLVAPMMVQRRSQGLRGLQREVQAAPVTKANGGLTGMRLYMRDSMLSVLIAPLSFIAVTRIMMLSEAGFQLPLSAGTSGVLFMATCFTSLIGYDLRILRSLPLSTSRLALLLMLGPIINGFFHSAIVTALVRSEFAATSPTLWFFTLFFSLSGGCALAIACWGQFALWKFALSAFLMIAVMFSSGVDHYPLIAPLVLSIGASALLLSFTLFKRGLGKSDVYQKQGVIFSNASLLKR